MTGRTCSSSNVTSISIQESIHSVQHIQPLSRLRFQLQPELLSQPTPAYRQYPHLISVCMLISSLHNLRSRIDGLDDRSRFCRSLRTRSLRRNISWMLALISCRARSSARSRRERGEEAEVMTDRQEEERRPTRSH